MDTFAMSRKSGNWLHPAGPPAGGEGLKWQTWQTFAIPKSCLSPSRTFIQTASTRERRTQQQERSFHELAGKETAALPK
jgi:hypothetical protein